MLIHIKLEAVPIGINYFIAGYNRYAIYNNFFFLIRIFPFVYTHPEYDAAFSSSTDFGFSYANYRILTFLAEQLTELVGNLGQHFYSKHSISHVKRGREQPRHTWPTGQTLPPD